MPTSQADVHATLAALERAQTALNRALRDEQNDQLADLDAEVRRLERERSRLVQQRTSRRDQFAQVPPVRAQVLAALNIAGRPVASRLLADIARARYGYNIETRGLASLRRDELRSWRVYSEHPERAVAKPDLIVPALSYDRFTPERGTLALSSWKLADRIVAPASGRVDVLVVASNLARLCMASPNDPWQADLARLAGRIGLSTRPFAGTLALPSPNEILDAAAAELGIIIPADQREREDSASRAAGLLGEEDQLFGAAPLGLTTNVAGKRVS